MNHQSSSFPIITLDQRFTKQLQSYTTTELLEIPQSTSPSSEDSNYTLNPECDLAISDVSKNLTNLYPEYPSLSRRFSDYCVEEGFDDIDILIDDFSEGFDESVILESVSKDIDLKEQDQQSICSTILQSLCSFGKTPQPFLSFMSLEVHQDDVYNMIESLSLEMPLLSPQCKDDLSLVLLLAIGDKNHIPLLQNLHSALTRWKVSRFKKTMNEIASNIGRKNRSIWAHYHGHCTFQDFVKSCDALSELNSKFNNQKGYGFYTTIKHGLQQFINRPFPCFHISAKHVNTKILDSLPIYCKYTVAMTIACGNIKKKFENSMNHQSSSMTDNNQRLPMQIDMLMIANGIVQHGVEGMDDDEFKFDTDKTYKLQAYDTLAERLEHCHNVFETSVKNINEIFVHKLAEKFENMAGIVSNRTAYKRVVFVVDRRNDYGGDRIYAYLPTNTFKISQLYTNLSMMTLSRTEVIPSVSGILDESSGFDCINALSPVDGQMFMLSYHINESIQSYWYADQACSRFFLEDICHVWPMYFENNNRQRNRKNNNNLMRMRSLCDKHKDILEDKQFDTFCQVNGFKI